jgi:hypothetical protein
MTTHSEWEDVAASFMGMTPEAKIEFMNKLADRGVGDDFLKAFFIAHRKLENENP